MRGILIAVLLGALTGGLGSYVLLPHLLAKDHRVELGGVGVQYEVGTFSKNELLLGVFLASLIGAVVATLVVWIAVRPGARRGAKKRR